MAFAPKTYDFYQAFEEIGATLTEASHCLKGFFADGADLKAGVASMRELELKADRLSRETLDRLNRTFITPIDRTDVHRVATKLDDVLDWMYAAGCRVEVYQLTKPPAYVGELADILIRAVEGLERAVGGLRDAQNREDVLQACQEVNEIENEADRKVHDSLAQLFANETDAIELIKIKEVLEHIENAADACEDVADAIQGVVLKSN